MVVLKNYNRYFSQILNALISNLYIYIYIYIHTYIYIYIYIYTVQQRRNIKYTHCMEEVKEKISIGLFSYRRLCCLDCRRLFKGRQINWMPVCPPGLSLNSVDKPGKWNPTEVCKTQQSLSFSC